MPSKLKGNINVMAFADILQWVAHGGKSGTLEVRGTKYMKNIYFDNGFIIATSSEDPKEYLGQFLISYGKITESGLRSVLEHQEKSELVLGRILVNEKILKESEMKLFLKLKAEESLYDIFLWEEGDFEFHEGKRLKRDFIDISLDVTTIILEGVRRVDEWRRIREVIPNDTFTPQVIVDKVIDALPLSGNLTKLLKAIDGKKSVADIAMEFRSSSFIVFKNLFECRNKGFIILKQPQGMIEAGMIEDIALKLTEKINNCHFLEGFILSETFLEKYPDSKVIQDKYEQIISRVNSLIEDGNAYPELALSMNELSSKELTPEEAFIISRINNNWDIKSIIKIIPIKEEKARIIFAELKQKGVIVFK